MDLRDTENVPFMYEGGIEAFLENEVKKYVSDAYVDDSKTIVGYEIRFTKHFYKPAGLRPMADIIEELKKIENETEGMMTDIIGGLVE